MPGSSPGMTSGGNREGSAPSPAIPQPRRYPIDRELNPAQHLLVRVLRAVFLQQFHLHMVERIEIGKTVADRAVQEWVALQQPFMPHDVEQRLDRGMPFAPDAPKNAFAQLHVR